MNTGPASTVNASVMDMANFARMLLDGGRFNGRQMLSGQSARAMLTRQFTNHRDQPGYGLTSPGHPPARALRPRLKTPVDLSRFLGRYANSMYHHTDPTRGWRPAPFELTADAEGRLIFNRAPAYPVGPLAFQRDDGVLLTFVEDSKGEIVRFVVNQEVFERLE